MRRRKTIKLNSSFSENDTLRSVKPWVVVGSRGFVVNRGSGSSVYVLSIVDYLRSVGFRVAFLALSPDGFGARPFVRLDVEVVEAFDDYLINGWTRFGTWAMRTDSPRPWLAAAAKLMLRKAVPKVGRWLPSRIRDWLNENVMRPRWDMSSASVTELDFADYHIQRLDPVAVYINYFYLAKVATLPSVAKIPSYILTHGVFFDRSAFYEEKNVRPEHPMVDWETEIAALAQADAVVAIQQTDADILQRLLPAGTVLTAPMAMVARQNNAVRMPGRCLYVGGSSQHNALGLRWFLEGVWPTVLAVEPAAHLHVCGSIKQDFRDSYPNVTFLGRVVDLATEYDLALICLIPLVVGSGLKIKLVEALCYGRTGVATSVGVQGLESDISEIIAIADDPAQFAAEVIDLLHNDGRRITMEAKAINFARQAFSADTCYRRLNPSFPTDG
ncbi:conserved hypothetical protein [Gammaproteobacteria bacterium]